MSNPSDTAKPVVADITPAGRDAAPPPAPAGSQARPLRERLRAVLDYDPKTGIFRFKAARGRQPAGAIAGCKLDTGYITIRFDGRRQYAHRLAWAYVYGVLPSGEIDHINGMRDDNRISNLRDVPRSYNQQNQRKAQSSNRSGYLGVSRTDTKSSYCARIFKNGKQIHLGSFPTPEAAYAAYLAAKRARHEGNTL